MRPLGHPYKFIINKVHEGQWVCQSAAGPIPFRPPKIRHHSPNSSRRRFGMMALLDAKGALMGLNAELRAKVEDYVNRSDREAEPVFVGRKDLFATVASAAQSCADGHPRGQTVCLAGPPGVGKTAFLDALRLRSLGGNWGGPPTLTVGIDPDELHDPRLVLAAVALAMPEKWRSGLSERIRKLMMKFAERAISISAFGARIALAQPEGPPPSLWDGLANLLPKNREAVLCLSVDEAHKLKPTPGEQDNKTLAKLHFGNQRERLPAFALLAGHSQTPDVIARSVSRRLAGGHLKYVQPLGRRESKAYVAGILEHCGVQGSAQEKLRFATWTVDVCGGFPHHLRSAMTALGGEILRADSTRLRDLDTSRMVQEIERLRREYYRHRVAGLRPAMPVVRKVLAKWGPNGATSREAAENDLADAIASVDAQRLARMRKAGIEVAEDLADRMVSRGLLSADEDGERWRCIIPSLRQHVLTDRFETPSPPNLSWVEGVSGCAP